MNGKEEPDKNQENVIDDFYELLNKNIQKNLGREERSFISIIRSISLFQYNYNHYNQYNQYNQYGLIMTVSIKINSIYIYINIYKIL